MRRVTRPCVWSVHSVTGAGSGGTCLSSSSASHVFGVKLGNGWFAKAGGQPGAHAAPPQLLLKANIRFANGAVQSVVSGLDWQCAQGPIVADSLYNGETFDARIAKNVSGWDTVGFDASNWANVTSARQVDSAKLSSQLFEPIRHIAEWKPLNITEPKPGMFVVDFGQNMAGYVWVSECRCACF